MIMAVTSTSSTKASRNLRGRHLDLPPSYDAAVAEPHGFIDGQATREEDPIQSPPEPLVSGGSSSEPLLSQNSAKQNTETILFLDPNADESHVGYMAPDELSTQCAQYGHVEKTRYGTLSILAAVAFFPWGLLCLIGSRVVYCERCNLVLRASLGRKGTRREHPCERHPSGYHNSRHRAQR